MATHDDSDPPQGPLPGATAAAELKEAFGHFRAAAQLLLDRAARDPALHKATSEAERLLVSLGARAEELSSESVQKAGTEAQRAIQRLTESAEPVGHKVAGELSRWAKRLGERLDAMQEDPPRSADDERKR